MPEPVSIQVGGNVEGSIVVGDHNFVVNTNHGTIVYKQAGPQVRARGFAPQPPRAPRGFINRTDELAKLEAWISAGEIVLLHAPDGMGKSAMLKQAANSAAARAMPNGVILLEGADVAGQALGPGDVVQQLFDALFESDPPLKVDAVSARTYLSNTRPLVLLDEVSLSPALQKTLPDLFPQGAILLSADLPLAGDFERLPIGPLPRHEALNLLATRADLTLNDANRAELDAICELLNDVSLAIVITGNILRETHTSPAQAAQALQKLAAPTQDPVSKALDRAFSFAFSKLSPEEQQVLSAAALTPGVSMSPEWLSAALGGTDVDVFVERLKELGLLFANSPRLRLPPGFRDAAQRAAVLDEQTLLPRLIEYLSAPLRANPQNWEHIGDELGNFIGALTWAVRSARWADVISLGRALDPYLTLHGLWDAWDMALGYILDAARQGGERAAQAWALHQRGVRQIGGGARQQALDSLKQALALRRELGDTTGMAYTQHNIDFLLSLPPAGQDGAPKPRPPKPPGGSGPWLLLGAAGAVGLLGLALVGLLAGIFLFPPPTATPSLTPTLTAILPAAPTFTATVTLTATATPTLTPTPLGGSGEIIFQALPDQFKEDDFLLYTLDVREAKPQPVFKEAMFAKDPAWSPNGQYLAFASRYNSDYTEIYTARADGSGLLQLSKGTGNKAHPTWSPDGRYIAFTWVDSEFGQSIYVMDADGGNVHRLLQAGQGGEDYPEWSPDGKRIAYQAFYNGNWEIFVVDVDGLKPLQLTQAISETKGEGSIQPSWSPDGGHIAFASNRNGSWDIYVMDDRGGQVSAVTLDRFDDAFPDWSPDGRMIVFISSRDGNRQIYLIGVDGSGLIQLTKISGDPSEPDWRPLTFGFGQ